MHIFNNIVLKPTFIPETINIFFKISLIFRVLYSRNVLINKQQ